MTGDKSYSVVFKNPGNGNHWLKLDLVGMKANRFAVGARLRIRVADADGAAARHLPHRRQRRQLRRVQPAPARRPRAGERVDAIEIRWPGSGETQRWSGPLAVDSRYALHQGDPQVRVVESGRQGRSSSPPANP